MSYLKGAKHLCLRGSLDSARAPENGDWGFYCDSDFAGNDEDQNKRRSQNGRICLLNGVPVDWGSKVSSVAFAHPQIEEAHADMSSGAAEVYSAANATFDFLHLSYIAQEMHIDFPLPIKLQMDNTTAEAFGNKTCYKSRLKHIDARQHWVKVLRDKKILIPVHVHTKINLADVFTKILPPSEFVRMISMMMGAHN
jgi:hypothetical protein